MSVLDALTVLISDHPGEDMISPRDAAATLIARGWRPPAQVIETPEELDTLPFLSIIREVFGPSPVAGCDYGGVWERRTSGWECIAAGVRRDAPRFPAVVLYLPTEKARPTE